jgi:hypothetical protein
MTPDELRTLLHRYYDYHRGGEPDPKQVEAIVQFARGLPMAVTAIVALWVKYQKDDFQAVQIEVTADLAQRLLKGVPKKTRPALEAAAVLRYFNADSLGSLLYSGSAEKLYDELNCVRGLLFAHVAEIWPSTIQCGR